MEFVARVEDPVTAPIAVIAAMLAVVTLKAKDAAAVPALLIAATDPEVPTNDPPLNPPVLRTVVAVVPVIIDPAVVPKLLTKFG
jgi:hypothetical protein